MAEPRYDVAVQLTGEGGNAFTILGTVKDALRKAGAPRADVEEFIREATSGDYDHLLRVCMEWVDVR